MHIVFELIPTNRPQDFPASDFIVQDKSTKHFVARQNNRYCMVPDGPLPAFMKSSEVLKVTDSFNRLLNGVELEVLRVASHID